MTTIHTGHDIAYLTGVPGCGGCAGAMAYYTASGEPPGWWAGKGAGVLGLFGEVDPREIERLYMKGIGPDGEVLVKPRQSKKAKEREEAAVAAYRAAHPYASAVEVAEVRVAERGRDLKTVPYFDVTVDLVKSVSVLHASFRVSARQAREAGDADLAGRLEAKAGEIERALMEAAREAVAWLEAGACYTRTGHHSGTTGEYRDGAGLTAAVFLHHISRDGDPHLHTHIAVMNKVQRADRADEAWRTLDSRALHAQRLALAAAVDRIMETKLTALGYVMVPREDGNGAEVGGVGQDVTAEFSSRSRALTPQLQALIDQYVKVHGVQPSKRTVWLLGQQAAQNTRRSKAEARRTVAGRTGTAEPTPEQRFAAWEAQTTRREVQALSQVHQDVAGFAAGHAGQPPAVLDDAAKRRAARIAVAEVQQHHATWSVAQLRFEVHRALPVLPADADAVAVITEVAELAVSGRAGTDVVCVTAPDVTDVTSLGVRESDGGSIYRPPHEERYATLAHLDTEEQILITAKLDVPQLVTGARARAAVAALGDDLNPGQAAAVVTMLTAKTTATALIAPAGSGKSHTTAVFAGLWEHLAGRRVIGLATSTNAAQVLAREGLAESYNIAEFLGKTEGSDQLRRPVPLHCGDVLVIDEATQVSTADLAMLTEAARAAGARIILTGDTEQLGAVDAGGMFRLLAREVPAAELTEILRFTSQWEADASVRLHGGEPAAVAVYDRHGRIRGADDEAARERAASLWLADHLDGKDTLLLAGSNEEAADLAQRVQARLIQLGHVSADGCQAQVPLGDGNQGRPGDLIRARLNTRIDAGGRKLANRDTLKISAVRGDGAEVRRRQPDGTWTEPFWIPREYLETRAELGYAGNVHVAQGRTVDTAHLLVTETLSRQSLYVGMTRGREANTGHVVTGSTAPAGHQPYEQATPEAVLKNILERDGQELSATEAIRQSQEWTGGTGHLAHLWAAAVRLAVHAHIDRQVTARLTEPQTQRYEREHSRKALHTALRAAQLAGHDINAVIGQITAAPLDGARSVSAVLHGRLKRLHLTDHGRHTTWTQRTPASAPPVALQLAEALDHRHRELGERLAASPEPWLTRHLRLEPGASPALKQDYVSRAAIVASYRENAGITNPEQAVSPAPHRGNPELEHQRQEAIRALEIRDEAALWAGMDQGQLEACQAAAQRATATAPADVSAQLRATAHAEADTRQQAADAQVRSDPAAAASASALAGQLAARRRQLEADDAKYEAWADRTRAVRENGNKAAAELSRRGHTRPASQHPPQASPDRPGSETQWFRQFDADIAAVERALDRERRTAEAAGQPWPPQRQPEPEPGAAPGETTLQWWRHLDTPNPDASHVDPAWHAQIKAGQTAGIQASQAESGSMAQWAQKLEADASAMDRAIGREHQAVGAKGAPWPPERHAETTSGRKPGPMQEWARELDTNTAAMDRAIDAEHQAADAAGQPWPPRREHAPGNGTEPQSAMQREPEPGQEITHVDPVMWAQAKAAQTAAVEADKAARREASARAVPVTDAEIELYGTGHENSGPHETPGQYHARLQSYAQWQPETHPEASPEPEASRETRAETPDHAEIEL